MVRQSCFVCSWVCTVCAMLPEKTSCKLQFPSFPLSFVSRIYVCRTFSLSISQHESIITFTCVEYGDQERWGWWWEIRAPRRPGSRRQGHGNTPLLIRSSPYEGVPLCLVVVLYCILHLVCNSSPPPIDQGRSRTFCSGNLDNQHLCSRLWYMHALCLWCCLW